MTRRWLMQEYEMLRQRVHSPAAKPPGSAGGNAAAVPTPSSPGEPPVVRPHSRTEDIGYPPYSPAVETVKLDINKLRAERERCEFRFLCEAFNLPMPCSEYRFHPHRKWRFDYAWPLPLIAVEVEGGLFANGGAGGRHNRGAGMREDMEKYNAATLLGWRVLRYLPEQLREEAMRDLRILFAG